MKKKRDRISQILQNFSLTVISILLCFILAEAFLRYFYPQGDHFYQPDLVLGAKLIPGKVGIWNIEGQIIPVTINQFGFRGWNYPQIKTAGVFRVAILGDSYVEALQVAEDKMFSYLLENKLNQKNTQLKYEVLPFGVSGYGTAQEYLLLTQEVQKFQPDLVVLAFTSANDVRNNLPSLEKNKQRPYFSLKDGELKSIKPEIQDSWLKIINRFFLNYSYFYRFIIVRVSRLPLPNQRASGDNIPIDFWIYSCDYNQVWQDAWQVTQKLILQMQSEAKKNHSKFLLLNLTGYPQIHENEGLTQLVKKYPDMTGKCWDLNKPGKILAEFVQRNQIIYLDLLPAFIKDYQVTRKEAHFLQDGHWNEYGHQLAAEIFGKFLQDNLLNK